MQYWWVPNKDETSPPFHPMLFISFQWRTVFRAQQQQQHDCHQHDGQTDWIGIEVVLKARVATTVNHLLLSYTITNLLANTRYKMCLRAYSPIHGSFVRSALGTTVMMTTRPAPQHLQRIQCDPKAGASLLAIGLNIALLLMFAIYFMITAWRRYRLQSQYEIPAQKIWWTCVGSKHGTNDDQLWDSGKHSADTSWKYLLISPLLIKNLKH